MEEIMYEKFEVRLNDPSVGYPKHTVVFTNAEGSSFVDWVDDISKLRKCLNESIKSYFTEEIYSEVIEYPLNCWLASIEEEKEDPGWNFDLYLGDQQIHDNSLTQESWIISDDEVELFHKNRSGAYTRHHILHFVQVGDEDEKKVAPAVDLLALIPIL
jgi:hypothetical protein